MQGTMPAAGAALSDYGKASVPKDPELLLRTTSETVLGIQ